MGEKDGGVLREKHFFCSNVGLQNIFLVTPSSLIGDIKLQHVILLFFRNKKT